MKRIFTTLLVAAGIAGPFMASVAAQSNHAVANIPFAFVASGRTLPAGRYDVSQMQPGSTIFTLRDREGHGLFVPFTQNENGNPKQASLTFACYGSQRILAKVTPPNSQTAYSLSQTSIEKSLRHTLGVASMVSVELSAR
jgi:hypothetical protein